MKSTTFAVQIPVNTLCPTCLVVLSNNAVMIRHDVGFCGTCFHVGNTDALLAAASAVKHLVRGSQSFVNRGISFFAPQLLPPVGLHNLPLNDDRFFDPDKVYALIGDNPVPVNGPTLTLIDETRLYDYAETQRLADKARPDPKWRTPPLPAKAAIDDPEYA